jgi:hypothetical protein
VKIGTRYSRSCSVGNQSSDVDAGPLQDGGVTCEQSSQVLQTPGALKQSQQVVSSKIAATFTFGEICKFSQQGVVLGVSVQERFQGLFSASLKRPASRKNVDRARAASRASG